MRPENFYASKYSSFSSCNFPTDLCGNLWHMDKLDTVIVHRRMLLYSVCAFPKITTQAFTVFSLALLSAILLGLADSCQQD